MKATILTKSLLSLALAAAPAAHAQVMSEGPPALIPVLGQQSFIPVELNQLSHASLWYANYDWLRKRGFKVPPQGIRDPQFEKQFLAMNAFQANGALDRPEDYTGVTKTAYADFYGGAGMNGNYGSGRATLNGAEQWKGNRTGMVADKDPEHSNGAIQAIDGIDEAIWSQILDTEFKYGANNVFGVIRTGTFATMPKNGQVFPRALMGREMAVRIAHFMLNHHLDAAQDRARVVSILPNLLKVLPYPNGVRPASNGAALKAGLLEFTYREAYTQAEYYAKRLYFGSDSPSNLEITGRRLDLAYHSAQLGYSKIYRPLSDGVSYFGEVAESLLTFDELNESFSKTLPKELLPFLPSKEEFRRHYMATYEKQLRIEMVRLTGAPHELVEELRSSESLKALGEVLLKISRAGNEKPVLLDWKGFKNSDLYPLNKMLVQMAQLDFKSAAQLESWLKTYISTDAALRSELASTYVRFAKELEALAPSKGLTVAALKTYLKEAARVRNQDRTSLILSDARISKLWSIADQGINTGNGAAVEDYIQEEVDHNVFNFKDAAPFHVVLKQKRRPAEGIVVREVFDARKNVYSTVVRIHVASGEGYFQGKKLSAESLRESALEHGGITAPAARAGDYVEFTFDGVRSVSLEKAKINPATVRGGTCRAAMGA